MLLDGELLSTDESLPVGEYVVYYKEIQHGFHQVRTQDGVATRVAVQVYGHGGAITRARQRTGYLLITLVSVCVGFFFGIGKGEHPVRNCKVYNFCYQI